LRNSNSIVTTHENEVEPVQKNKFRKEYYLKLIALLISHWACTQKFTYFPQGESIANMAKTQHMNKHKAKWWVDY